MGSFDGGLYKTIFPNPELILAYEPDRTSSKNALHIGQLIEGPPRLFDYGAATNQQKYGQNEPPLLNLTNLSASGIPTFIYVGRSDSFCREKDVEYLNEQLTSVANSTVIQWLDGYGHLDFIWSVEATCQVYQRIVESLYDINNLQAPPTPDWISNCLNPPI